MGRIFLDMNCAMKWHRFLVVTGLCLLSICHVTTDAAGQYTVSYGREKILDNLATNHGLPIAAYGVYDPVMYPLNYPRFLSSNYSYPQNAVTPEAVAALNGANFGLQANGSLSAGLYLPYANQLVSLDYQDEPPASFVMNNLPVIREFYRAHRAAYPNAIMYLNSYWSNSNGGFASFGNTEAGLRTYMQTARPDMLSFDEYPSSYSFSSSDRNSWYSATAMARKVALEGYDGTGTSPIVYGQYMKMYRPTWTSALPSESFIRMQRFVSLAFGYTFINDYAYNRYPGAPDATVLFSTTLDSSPTIVFNYVAEANRQIRNLSPALARLVSSDIRLIPGSGQSVSNTGVTQWAPYAGTTAGYTDYIDGILPTVSQGGAPDTSYRDTFVGYFKPLLADNSGNTFVDGLHFMIVNGATGTPFAYNNSAGDLASASAQWYHLVFNFTGSSLNSLVRLSRDTGKVELVPLTQITGQYYSLDLNLPGGTGDLFGFWNSSNPLPTIPEPGSLVLLGTGLVGLLCYVWRKRR